MFKLLKLQKNASPLRSVSIFLRFLTPEDVTEAYVAWLNDPEINRFLEVRWARQTLSDVRTYVHQMQKSQTDFLYGIFSNSNQEHIGNIKLGKISPIHHYADIGLFIGNKAYWGRGIGTESIILVTDFAFHTIGLQKVTAGMTVNNQSSYKSFLKAGFREVGIQKNHTYFDEGFIDSYLLEKIAGNQSSCSPE